MKPRKEADVTKEIQDWLDEHRFVWIRCQPVRITSRGFMPVRPSQKGAPDLFVFPAFGSFKFLAVEVKGPKGKPSPAQIKWAALVKAVGGRHVFAYSLDDMTKALAEK